MARPARGGGGIRPKSGKFQIIFFLLTLLFVSFPNLPQLEVTLTDNYIFFVEAVGAEGGENIMQIQLQQW